LTAFGLLGSLLQTGPVNTVKGIGNYIGKYTNFLTNLYPNSVRLKAETAQPNYTPSSGWRPTNTAANRPYTWPSAFSANAVKQLSI
jgi:hypothetical protein